MNRRTFLALIAIGGAMLGAAAFTLLYTDWYNGPLAHRVAQFRSVLPASEQENGDMSFFNIGGIVEPTPTPPFYDMTIPHLRSRTYESSLAELQRHAQTGTYTSYLTSYTSDGLRVNGLLTIPSGERPTKGWPAVVFIHGYIPPTIYRTTQNYASYVDYFARRGFVVFKIDLRGHDQSEGEPHGAYYSSDYVIDALNARAALQEADFVDDDAVGLWGHSMAGNVVFRAAVAAQDIPATVIWAGAVYTYEDWQELGLNDNSYRPPTDQTERQRRRRELFETHGEFDPNNSFWKQVVPVNYLGGVTGGVQIHHAVDDSVVSIEYSRGLKEALESAETQLQLSVFEYSSGGHNLDGAAFTSAMQRSAEFFEERLR